MLCTSGVTRRGGGKNCHEVKPNCNKVTDSSPFGNSSWCPPGWSVPTIQWARLATPLAWMPFCIATRSISLQGKHILMYKTRYTVRGRGAKHFFPSGSGLEPTFYLIRSRTSLPELSDFRQSRAWNRDKSEILFLLWEFWSRLLSGWVYRFYVIQCYYQFYKMRKIPRENFDSVTQQL